MSCSGRCCEYFTMGLSPSEIKRRAEKNPNSDFAKYQDMLIPLYYEKNCGSTGSHFYTCKYYNKETRRCTNYANRPNMCSAYPNGMKCGHSKICQEKGDLK